MDISATLNRIESTLDNLLLIQNLHHIVGFAFSQFGILLLVLVWSMPAFGKTERRLRVLCFIACLIGLDIVLLTWAGAL